MTLKTSPEELRNLVGFMQIYINKIQTLVLTIEDVKATAKQKTDAETEIISSLQDIEKMKNTIFNGELIVNNPLSKYTDIELRNLRIKK